MVARMPLQKGSKAPQKLRSNVVTGTVALFKQTTAEELLVIRKLLLAEFTHRDLAAARGSSLYPTSTRNRALMALDLADLNYRRAHPGRGLRTIADYENAMKDAPDAPSANWIARLLGGGSWPKALVVAGIGGDRYLEPTLIRGSGSRTRPGSGEAWTDEECDEALAFALDMNHGYDVTKGAYEHYRDIVSHETPTYPTLLGKRYENNKLVGGVTLAARHERAKALILREPERFQNAAPRLQLVAEVQQSEQRSERVQKQPKRRAA